LLRAKAEFLQTDLTAATNGATAKKRDMSISVKKKIAVAAAQQGGVFA
jgi:hypothetical protein